jgi:hypothetical protein
VTDFVAPRSTGRRLPFAVYPAAVVVLVCLHLWVVSGVSPFAAVRALGASIAVGLAVAAVAGAVMHDRDRGGLLGLLLAVSLVAGGRPVVVLLLLVPAALLIIERYGPRHLSLNWAWIGRLVSRVIAVFALAILIEAVQLGRLGDIATALQREGPLRTASASASAAATTANGPDVYVLLLDGYARADILQERFSVDDGPFLDALRDRGFGVANGSHSNYLVTNLSLTSFLNHRHLTDLPVIEPLLLDPGASEGPHVFRAAGNPAILGDFRALGYETIAVSSGFEQVAVRGADRFIDAGQVNEFEIQLMRPGLLPAIATLVSPDVFSSQQRSRIESVYASVEQLAAKQSAQPRFVFAHVPSPHAPWVMNADGSPRTATNFESWYADTPGTTGLSREEVIEGYRGQAAYLAHRTLAAIDAIQAGSTRPPVILVLSDHGSSLDVSVANPETRLRNLFAAYVPEHEGLFPDDVTLVNVFPTLFSAYFDEDLGTSPDTLYTEGPRGLFDPVPIATVP